TLRGQKQSDKAAIEALSGDVKPTRHTPFGFEDRIAGAIEKDFSTSNVTVTAPALAFLHELFKARMQYMGYSRRQSRAICMRYSTVSRKCLSFAGNRFHPSRPSW